jgi:hypothetical protein
VGVENARGLPEIVQWVPRDCQSGMLGMVRMLGCTVGTGGFLGVLSAFVQRIGHSWSMPAVLVLASVSPRGGSGPSEPCSLAEIDNIAADYVWTKASI